MKNAAETLLFILKEPWFLRKGPHAWGRKIHLLNNVTFRHSFKIQLGRLQRTSYRLEIHCN